MRYKKVTHLLILTQIHEDLKGKALMPCIPKGYNDGKSYKVLKSFTEIPKFHRKLLGEVNHQDEHAQGCVIYHADVPVS